MTYSKEIQLDIAQWRLTEIEQMLEQATGGDDVHGMCQEIIYLRDSVIVDEYLG